MRMMILAAVGLSAVATGAVTQEWTPHQGEGLSAAAQARWPSGAILFARCDAGQLALLAPLAAPIEGDLVRVEYAFDGADPVGESWSVSGDGRTVFARNPGRFARALMGASSLSLHVAGDSGPSQRFNLDLSDQAEPLARTLTACGERLQDPSDALPLITNPQWAQRPNAAIIRNLYPLEAAAAGQSGVAHAACIARWDGVLEDCRLLSETPRAQGFGEATLGAARHHRLEPVAPQGSDPRRGLVHLSIRWQVG